jgi:membrane-associated phospholipid phosphatase
LYESLFSTYWTEILRKLLPWAVIISRILSFFGSEYFFVAIIAIGYWAVDKNSSKKAALLLLFSSITNYWLKITIRNPRPLPSNWLPGITASNYSLPSGHAQNSTTFWGWFGMKTEAKWKKVLYIGIIFLVGLSRIYMGVHWLVDVIVGWITGFVLLFLIRKLGNNKRYSLVDSESFNTGLVLFGLVATILTEAFSSLRLTGLEANFGAIGGLMIGMGIGFTLEKRYIDFEICPDHSLWKLLLRVGFGLFLVFLVMIGLSSILPSEVYWLSSIRYALVALMALFVWPYVFTKFNI